MLVSLARLKSSLYLGLSASLFQEPDRRVKSLTSRCQIALHYEILGGNSRNAMIQCQRGYISLVLVHYSIDSSNKYLVSFFFFYSIFVYFIFYYFILFFFFSFLFLSFSFSFLFLFLFLFFSFPFFFFFFFFYLFFEQGADLRALTRV